MKASDAKGVNVEYYRMDSPGRADYWRRMAAPRARMARFLKLMKNDPPASVVDLGCGNGDLLCEVGKAFPKARLCGIDLSPTLIAANIKRCSHVTWKSMDLDVDADFDAALLGAFDVVIASEIIEHVEHPDMFLTNALKLARPQGGRLLLSTQSGRMWETERRVGHRRHFSRQEMKALLVSACWQVEGVWNEGCPFHDLAKRMANARPEKTMKAYSEKSYSLFQKCICLLLRAAYRFNSRGKGAQLFAVARRG
jgi:2-polyprenyl-3-methyl-5-hydroxy-6-metoxy-1,4-benzoquinol methylase